MSCHEHPYESIAIEIDTILSDELKLSLLTLNSYFSSDNLYALLFESNNARRGIILALSACASQLKKFPTEAKKVQIILSKYSVLFQELRCTCGDEYLPGIINQLDEIEILFATMISNNRLM